MNPNKIGKFILQLRKENNLTQAEFADMFGVTYQAVSKWENGKNIPDLLILKEICNKFNVDLNEVLDGDKKKTKKGKRFYIIISIISILVILASIFIYIKINETSDFEFKTLSSNCKNFNINGSLAYSASRSHIYISSIEYCGGNDTTEYMKIECSLVESYDNVDKKVDSYVKESEEGITLEEFLKNVTFYVDNYSLTCKDFSKASLFLKIYATDRNGKVTSYNVPLNQQASCPVN